LKVLDYAKRTTADKSTGHRRNVAAISA